MPNPNESAPTESEKQADLARLAQAASSAGLLNAGSAPLEALADANAAALVNSLALSGAQDRVFEFLSVTGVGKALIDTGYSVTEEISLLAEIARDDSSRKTQLVAIKFLRDLVRDIANSHAEPADRQDFRKITASGLIEIDATMPTDAAVQFDARMRRTSEIVHQIPDQLENTYVRGNEEVTDIRGGLSRRPEGARFFNTEEPSSPGDPTAEEGSPPASSEFLGDID